MLIALSHDCFCMHIITDSVTAWYVRCLHTPNAITCGCLGAIEFVLHITFATHGPCCVSRGDCSAQCSGKAVADQNWGDDWGSRAVGVLQGSCGYVYTCYEP